MYLHWFWTWYSTTTLSPLNIEYREQQIPWCILSYKPSWVENVPAPRCSERTVRPAQRTPLAYVITYTCVMSCLARNCFDEQLVWSQFFVLRSVLGTPVSDQRVTDARPVAGNGSPCPWIRSRSAQSSSRHSGVSQQNNARPELISLWKYRVFLIDVE